MHDVAQRIGELALQERAPAPIGEARALVEVAVEQPLRQHGIAHGLAEAAHHGRDLGVENRVRDDAREVVDDLNVLAGGMEDLEDPLVHHELEEGHEVELGREAVDEHLGAIGGHLDEAELRPEGLLPHKLGIERNKGRLGQPLACCGKLVRTRDEIHVRVDIAQGRAKGQGSNAAGAVNGGARLDKPACPMSCCARATGGVAQWKAQSLTRDRRCSEGLAWGRAQPPPYSLPEQFSGEGLPRRGLQLGAQAEEVESNSIVDGVRSEASRIPGAGQDIDAGHRGDRYADHASGFSHFFLCPTVYEVELSRYVECACAGCVPIGEAPTSLHPSIDQYLVPSAGQARELVRTLKKDGAELRERAAGYRSLMRTLRDSAKLASDLEDQIRRFV